MPKLPRANVVDSSVLVCCSACLPLVPHSSIHGFTGSGQAIRVYCESLLLLPALAFLFSTKLMTAL